MQKASGSAISNRIRMKFGRSVQYTSI